MTADTGRPVKRRVLDTHAQLVEGRHSPRTSALGRICGLRYDGAGVVRHYPVPGHGEISEHAVGTRRRCEVQGRLHARRLPNPSGRMTYLRTAPRRLPPAAGAFPYLNAGGESPLDHEALRDGALRFATSEIATPSNPRTDERIRSSSGVLQDAGNADAPRRRRRWTQRSQPPSRCPTRPRARSQSFARGRPPPTQAPPRSPRHSGRRAPSRLRYGVRGARGSRVPNGARARDLPERPQQQHACESGRHMPGRAAPDGIEWRGAREDEASAS